MKVEAVPKVLLDALEKKTNELLELKTKIVEANDKMFSDCLDYLTAVEHPFEVDLRSDAWESYLFFDTPRHNNSGIIIHKLSFHTLITPSTYNQIIEKKGYCDDVYAKFRKEVPKSILDEIKQVKSLVSEYKIKDKSVYSFCRNMNKQFNVDIKTHYEIFKAKYA